MTNEERYQHALQEIIAEAGSLKAAIIAKKALEGDKDECREKLAHLENFYQNFARTEYLRGKQEERERILKALPEEVREIKGYTTQDAISFHEGRNDALKEVKKIIDPEAKTSPPNCHAGYN